MKTCNFLKIVIVAIAGAISLSCCDNKDYDKIGKTEVTIETDHGNIVLRLYDDTPEYRDNFVRLIRKKAYDGAVWHRIVPEGLIQAGTVNDHKYAGKTLPSEIVYPKHFHKAGALAAAREDDDKNPGRRSSNTQFYIVTGKVYTPGELIEEHMNMQECDTSHVIPSFTDYQKKIYTTKGGAPFLDSRYTVFGEVVDGMGVVQYFGKQKSVDEKPVKRLVLKSIRVTKEEND